MIFFKEFYEHCLESYKNRDILNTERMNVYQKLTSCFKEKYITPAVIFHIRLIVLDTSQNLYSPLLRLMFIFISQTADDTKINSLAPQTISSTRPSLWIWIISGEIWNMCVHVHKNICHMKTIKTHVWIYQKNIKKMPVHILVFIYLSIFLCSLLLSIL